MKKQIFTAVAVFAAITMSVTSCSKEDTAAPVQVNTAQKAAVYGIAKAELDLTNGRPEFAPIGTKVFVKVLNSSLNSLATSGYYITETTIGANGAYSADVPVSAQGSVITVSFDEFTATVQTTTTTTQKQKFSASSVTKSGVLPGTSAYMDNVTFGGSIFE